MIGGRWGGSGGKLAWSRVCRVSFMMGGVRERAGMRDMSTVGLSKMERRIKNRIVLLSHVFTSGLAKC